MPRSSLTALVVIFAVSIFGCGQKAATPVPLACDTLTRETVAQVQGEQVVDTKASQSGTGDLSVSQCFYQLPTFSKSVNLEVTQGTPAALEAYWDKRFRNRTMSEEEEEELERQQKEGKPAEDDAAKKPAGPQEVEGLGDEAFWIATQISGSLFIRRGSAVYRVNLGGADEPATKLEKAKALANSFLNKKD